MSDYFKKYLRHKIWYWNNKLFLRIKLQFASGNVFRRSLYSSIEASVCLNSVTTVFLLARSSHYTSGSHPRFALSVHILPVRHFAVRKLPNPLSFTLSQIPRAWIFIHLYTANRKPAGSMQLRHRGHNFALPTMHLEFNKRHFVARVLFVSHVCFKILS